MRPLLTTCLGAALLGGCQRDPGFVGYWEIVAVERDGQRQTDVGFLDFDGELGVQFFSRYLFTAGSWAPDPHPELRFGASNVQEQDDVFEAYQEEGETFDLVIGVLSPDPFAIDDYHPWRAEVSNPGAWWPAASGESAPIATGTSPVVPNGRPTTLIIRR